jgi:transglutaminase-like putative cysteine protease
MSGMWLSVVAEEEDEYGAAVELREWSCEVKGNKATIKVHERLRVDGRRGDKYAQLYFDETPFRKLKKVHITVKNSSGVVIGQYTKKNLFKTCGFGAAYSVYDDICFYSLNAASATYPYWVDIEYEKELKSLFFLNGFVAVSELPVDRATFEITYPEVKPLRFKAYAVNLKYEEKIQDGTRYCRWWGDSLMPPERDTLSAVDRPRAGMVAILPFEFKFAGNKFQGDTWADIGRWYQEVVKDRFRLKEDVQRIAADDSVDMRSITKAVYEEVCDQMRYVSVSIGVSGWKPRRADKVQTTGYGDCKDLSTILIAKLRNRGIKAYPALVLTRDEGPLDVDFPNVGFNHVITAAMVGADTIWMDPTCNICPFGDLPYSSEDLDVLLITDSGGVMVRTPSSTAADNKICRHTKLNIGAGRELTMTARVTFTGNIAQRYRSSLSRMERTEIRDLVREWLVDSPVRCSVDSVDVRNLDDRSLPLVITFTAVGKRPLLPIKEQLFIDPTIYPIPLSYTPEELQKRRSPAKHGYPREVCDTVVLVWDEALPVDSVILPPSSQTSCMVGDLHMTCRQMGDSVVVVMSRAVKVYEVPPEYFEDLLTYQKALNQMDGECVRLCVSEQ